MEHEAELLSSQNYLVVVVSEAKYASRRRLIRSSYFDIYDNLVPVEFNNNIQYTFLIHGGPPTSNTPERRQYEAELMEYNDIIELPSDNNTTIIDWISSNRNYFLANYDYVIIQDIHSFMDLNRIIRDIESSGDKYVRWDNDSKNMIVHKDQAGTDMANWSSQIWENNIESVNRKSILITNLYQDQDFYQVINRYEFQPIKLINTQKKSLAVVTSSFIYDKCMEPSGTKSAKNKRDYANQHGYAFVARSGEFEQQLIKNRKIVWGKIDMIQKVLPKYEWLFWLDMDAVILNKQQSVESLFNRLKVDDNINFIIARPGKDKMINAGVFFIRNTPWSFQFLNQVQNQTKWYKQGPSYEQGALWDVMQTHMEHVLFLDRENHLFNTFPNLYEQDDFIVHFAPDKCPNSATLKGLSAAEKISQGHKISKFDLTE